MQPIFLYSSLELWLSIIDTLSITYRYNFWYYIDNISLMDIEVNNDLYPFLFKLNIKND